ncbi:MAG: DUF58 domain-containing protein [Maritimibacter sp.]
MRARAETLAGPLPPLLARAQHLAAGIVLGDHGRRRPGMGDAFWQYRAAQPGDSARSIDWRRSARSDVHFVQDKEWQAAQSVVFWVDRSKSMQFASKGQMPKGERAAVLALALSVLLVRGGERVGLTDMGLRPMRGTAQLMRMTERLLSRVPDEYGVPDVSVLPRHSRAVFASDFLSDMAPVEAALTTAADKGVTGVLLQVLDPFEEAFPFQGRTVFESMGGGVEFETRKAGDLRDRYLDRLKARKDHLARLAQTTGWRYHVHHTQTDATKALLWLYHALEGQS